MRKLFCLFLLVFCFLIAGAKEDNFILRGYITRADSSKWTGLDSVTINISALEDTTALKYKLLAGNREEMMTNEGGEVRALIDGRPGRYMLTLDREGFEPVMREFERKYRDQNVVWIGTISMHPVRQKVLDEVEVVATAIKMVMKGDTIVYNADAFKLAEGSMLDALIRQLPNAQLSADGEITVNGRKINSLLINGKDFFNGDMEVAMKNLPAYTVKTVEVYDKASEDDYLTQSSHKLSRREDEENLVMDVVLKKEYSIGWMASAEAGYGTDNRWKGKAFGLGFSDQLRISAFFNANNIKDTSEGGTNGNWKSGWNMPSGEARLEMGGIDYLYEKKDKFRVNGNVIYSHETYDSRSETASTRFYPSGDLYRRSSNYKLDKRRHLRSNHNMFVKTKYLFFNVSPSIDWMLQDVQTIERQATFNEMPEESTRTEALDSVFARPFSKRYNDIMLTRLKTSSIYNPGWFGAKLNTNLTFRHPAARGKFSFYANGNYATDWTDKRTVYAQHFGGANTNPGAPVMSDRYSETRPITGKFSGGISYGATWDKVDEYRTNTFSLHAGTNYHFTHLSHDYTLFTADGDDNPDPLPSLTMPQHAIADLRNSYNSIDSDHNIESELSLNFSSQPSTEADSCMNAAISAGGTIKHKFRYHSLDYNTLTPTKEHVLRQTNIFTPSLYVNFSSSNKFRYISSRLNYNLGWSEPSINLFLHNRESSDPLVVYENNANQLRLGQRHSVSFSFHRYGRIVRNNLSVNASWSTSRDAIGNASIYNPETGVTIYKPMNINGNWNSNASTHYSHTFGTRKQITLGGGVNANYSHSVDFQTSVGEPERSLVKNLSFGGSVNATYQFKNGSNVYISGSTSRQNSRGTREGFREITAMNYRANLGATVEIPWNIQLRTNFSMSCNSGYEVSEMNKAQWLWNMSASKSIMKGNLIFKIEANDILAQVKPYSIYVNAQGRYETWTNTMRRYALFSVIYRFNKHPKNAGGERKRKRVAL